MASMAMKGKYFHIDERTADEFDAWCTERRWINQGALFEALLRYAMAASTNALVALLEGRTNKAEEETATPDVDSTVQGKREKAKSKRRPTQGRG